MTTSGRAHGLCLATSGGAQWLCYQVILPLELRGIQGARDWTKAATFKERPNLMMYDHSKEVTSWIDYNECCNEYWCTYIILDECFAFLGIDTQKRDCWSSGSSILNLVRILYTVFPRGWIRQNTHQHWRKSSFLTTSTLIEIVPIILDMWLSSLV